MKKTPTALSCDQTYTMLEYFAHCWIGLNSNWWSAGQDKMKESIKLLNDVLKCVVTSSFSEVLRCLNFTSWGLNWHVKQCCIIIVTAKQKTPDMRVSVAVWAASWGLQPSLLLISYVSRQLHQSWSYSTVMAGENPEKPAGRSSICVHSMRNFMLVSELIHELNIYKMYSEVTTCGENFPGGRWRTGTFPGTGTFPQEQVDSTGCAVVWWKTHF